MTNKYYLSYWKNYFTYGITILGLLLSVIGSYQLYDSEPFPTVIEKALMIFYASVKLFLFSPAVGTPEAFVAAPFAYQAAIFIAPIGTILGVFRLFSDIYLQVRRSFLGLYRPDIVVLGYNRQSWRFMRNYRIEFPADRILCLVDQPLDQEQERQLLEASILVREIDYTKEAKLFTQKMLKRAKVFASNYLVSFEEEPRNYSYLNKLHHLLSFGDDQVIPVYVKSQNKDMKDLLVGQLDQLHHFDIQYFNLNDLAMIDLIQYFKFPLVEPMIPQDGAWNESTLSLVNLSKVIGNEHLVIYGFDDRTIDSLSMIANQTTVNLYQPLKVTIIADGDQTRFDDYLEALPNITKVFNLSYYDRRLNTISLKRLIKELDQQDPIDVVLFCTDDVEQSLLTITHNKDVLGQIPVACYCEDPVQVTPLIEGLEAKGVTVYLYGDPQRILTPKMILKEDYIRNAQLFNAEYKRVGDLLQNKTPQAVDPVASWRSLTAFNKESSLYQSLHRLTKLQLLEALTTSDQLPDTPRDIVLEWLNRLRGKSVEEQIQVIEQDVFMNYMTALEHKRWNTFHYLKGYTYGPEKNANRKTHNCLIDDWDDFLVSDQRDKAIYDFVSVLSVLDEDLFE